MRTIIYLLICTLTISSINAQSWQTIFYDDFNRADGAIGSNYTTNSSAGIIQLAIFNNEVKVSSGATSPAYWIISYNNAVDYDSIRVSCKFRAPNLNYGFSVNARDNGIYTYSAGIMANADTIAIYKRNYTGSSTKLAGTKANLDITKTYYLEFILLGADLTCKFVKEGMTDTITINATDNSLTGNNVSLSSYYYTSNLSNYIDDFKIEEYSNLTGISNIEKNNYSIFPNPAYDIVTFNIDNINNTGLKVNFYNVNGALVKSEILKQNNRQININDLSNGMYIIKAESKELTLKQKFIINR